jgi:gamma-glutamylcyclotransferase (GGCT)/AIG2-like uncharacterized protein YtfP
VTSDQLAALIAVLRDVNQSSQHPGDEKPYSSNTPATEDMRAAIARQVTMVNPTPMVGILSRAVDHVEFRLAVYGSLAPGKPNHHQLESLEGSWEEGIVRGHLDPAGWGQAMGFPGIRWDPESGAVPVLLFTSRDLPRHWRRLDAFEGSEYRRILVPVEMRNRVVAANIYEIVAPGGAGHSAEPGRNGSLNGE